VLQANSALKIHAQLVTFGRVLIICIQQNGRKQIQERQKIQ